MSSSISSAELIYKVGRAQEQYANQQLSQFGLNMDHAHILLYVSKNPGTIQKDIADSFDFQPASLANMIKSLEKQDYIIRRKSLENKRFKQLYLLPDGQKYVDAVNNVFSQLDELFTQLSPDTYQYLAQQLKALKS